MDEGGASATPRWVTHRWKRYGQERVYARTPGGTELGYFDVQTGRFHPGEPADLALLEKAIADHFRDGPQLQSPTVSLAFSADHPPMQTNSWSDISTVEPGAAAWEQAEIAMEAFRVQHRWLAFFGFRGGRSWRVGAAGERAVAAQLAALGPDWRVLHSVRVGTKGSDIDHVAIGPTGVFTVNAKNHPNGRVWVGGDTFIVNGKRYPYIRNSRHEAERTSRLLSQATGLPVQATAIIAVMGAQKGLKIKSQPKDGMVFVVARRRIAFHLARQPKRLSSQTVEAIYEAARRSTTWR